MLNCGLGKDRQERCPAGANGTPGGAGDSLLRLSSSPNRGAAVGAPPPAQNPNYRRLQSHNQRYAEEMRRLGVRSRRGEGGGILRGGGLGGEARDDRAAAMPRRRGGLSGGRERGSHRASSFAASASISSAGGLPPPPVENLEIRRNDIGLSGLTGIGSVREAVARWRREGGGEYHGRGGKGNVGGGSMDGGMRIREGGGRHQRIHSRDETNGFGGSKNKDMRCGARKRSWSPGHYRSLSRSRRSHGSHRSPGSSRRQRRNCHRSSRRDHKRRMRGIRGSSRSSSRSRSRSSSIRDLRRHCDKKAPGVARERARRSRQDECRRRGGHRNRDSESPDNPGDVRRHRHHRRHNERERRNDDGGGDCSSPTYIVSEDSENYAAMVAAQLDFNYNNTPPEYAHPTQSFGLTDKTTRGEHSGGKKSRGDDGSDGGGKHGRRCHHRRRRRRDRRRSPSPEESSGGHSTDSYHSTARRSRSSRGRRKSNEGGVGFESNYYNNEASYNPPPLGLQLGSYFSRRDNLRTESPPHSPLLGPQFASPRDRFCDNHLSDKKGKERKRRKRHRSLSDSSRSRSRSWGYSRRKGRRGCDDDASRSDSNSSSSDYGRNCRRHGIHCGGDDDADGHKSKGQSAKHSRHSRRKTRKRRHRRSDNHAAGGQSDSSRDDTVGHFRGGPGTMVGRHYRIVQDVGMGTFGRVVQCEDLRRSDAPDGVWSVPAPRGWDRWLVDEDHRDCEGRGQHRTVAIKIVRSVRRYHESALIEAEICGRVNREQSRQRRDLCARLLDRFSLPSGHYCLVFECLGRSLYDFLKTHDYRPFPVFCVRDFARRLLEALEFMHGFGLIHTDLKPENVLLSNDEETTYRQWDGSSCRVPASTAVKVIDFGGATYDDEKKSSIVNTRQYRAPEVILGVGWSYPSDLWSAGCIIAELYTGELLFATHDNAEHLALMERAVGPFPMELLNRARSSTASGEGSSLARECFDSRGWHKIRGVLSSRSIEHVRKMVPVEQIVLEHDRPTGLGHLLRSLLTIDPKRRATAKEALMSPFFTQLG